MQRNRYKTMFFVLTGVLLVYSLWIIRANNFYTLERRIFKDHRHSFILGNAYYVDKK